MANLTVRKIDQNIVKALKERAGKKGISAEAEHRIILEKALLFPQRQSFLEVVTSIPSVGRDSDFERKQDDTDQNVFT